MRRRHWPSAIALCSALAHADGSALDRIETPYVTLLEHELEYDALFSQQKDAAGASWMRQQVSYGHTLAERWSGEIEAVAARAPGAATELEAIALELKYQLTEQGEYGTDWGWLGELERGTGRDRWELSNMLIAARDWGRWTGIANFTVVYEWGDSLAQGQVGGELETRFAAQLKYRRGMAWEPALELHLAQDTRALGPVVAGTARVGPRRKLRWQAGALLGLDRDTPDLNLKFALEYEF